MARGRFGHRPRASGNLTALVAQLYREQQAANDRVMFDAYQNGGKGLDGKPVTDQSMRGYIASRRNGFSKDDPLYSEWNNRLIQLDFKIGEEKVTLAYQQGKVGAGAVASYYRHQLSSIPQNSAFYRDVAGRAAQWAKAAAGAARGRAASRLSAALEGKQSAVEKTWADYSQLESILTGAAKRAGLIAGNQTLTDADATDLQALLSAGVVGPRGTKITYADWQHATVAAYRGFDTLIAINKQLNRGYKTLQKQKQSFLDDTVVRVNTIDDRAKYEMARDAFEQATKDAGGNPQAVLDAAAAYAKTLTTIKTSAEKVGGLQANDAEFIGGLNNEITALTTGKGSGSSVFDLQSTTGEGTPTSDITDTAASIAKAQEDVKALTNGDAFYGQQEFGGKFQVVYYPPGAKLDPFGNSGLDSSFQKSVTSIDGVPTEVMLKGQPVQAFGLVDPNGNPLDSVSIGGQAVPVANLTAGQIAQLIQSGYKRTEDPQTLGYVFTDPTGKATKFGVVNADGSLTYTTANPFGPSLTPAGDNGFVLFAGSVTNPNNNRPVVTAPQITINGDSFLADEGITPKDLLMFAADPKNAGIAAQLIATADKRQADATAERDYMARARQNPEQPTGIVSSITGLVTDALSGVSTAVKNAGAPTLYDQPAIPTLPGLKPLGAVTPTMPSPAPSVSPTPTIVPDTTRTGTNTTVGKLKDDLTNVSNTPAPTGNATALGQASSDLLQKLLNPKAPTQGGSGGKYAL